MRILIVDDHLLVREGVKCLFAAMSDTEVFEADSIQDALSLYRAKAPDVLLLDLNLPNSSGFEILTRLLIEDRLAKIIVFSMHTEPIYVTRTLNAGARGYISKNAPARELIDAVHAVAAGGRYVDREIASQLVISRLDSANPLEKLTTREVDIVRLLGEGKNQLAIASALGITHKTVANACSIIKSKLGVEHTFDLIRLLHQMEEH